MIRKARYWQSCERIRQNVSLISNSISERGCQPIPRYISRSSHTCYWHWDTHTSV